MGETAIEVCLPHRRGEQEHSQYEKENRTDEIIGCLTDRRRSDQGLSGQREYRCNGNRQCLGDPKDKAGDRKSHQTMSLSAQRIRNRQKQDQQKRCQSNDAAFERTGGFLEGGCICHRSYIWVDGPMSVGMGEERGGLLKTL